MYAVRPHLFSVATAALLAGLFAWTNSGLAGSATLSQQGRLYDSGGVPLEGAQQMTFELYGSETGGSPVWTESQYVPLESGYYSAILGNITALDASYFADGTMWLQLTVEGTTLSPRHELVAVPMAMHATTAQHLSGGSVDATEILIDGVEVIDADGNWVGPSQSTGSSTSSWAELTDVPSDLQDGDSDALAGISCFDGGIPTWNISANQWVCGTDSDTLGSLVCLDGAIPIWNAALGSWYCGSASDSDTLADLTCSSGAVPQWDSGQWTCGTAGTGGGATLTEAQVEDYVTDGALDLASGTTLDGVLIATIDDVGTGSGGTVSESLVENYVTNDSIDLASGSTVDGVVIATIDDIGTGSGGTVSESLVESYVTNDAIDLFEGSTMDGADLVTTDDLDSLNTSVDWSEITNAPSTTLSDLICPTNHFPLWNGLNWVCSEIVDNDTLADLLLCTPGQIPQRTSDGWGCGDAPTGGGGGTVSEFEVEGYVTNDAIDLFEGSTVNGVDIATTADLTTSLDWSAITGIPTDIADGDTQLTEAEVETFVENAPINLAADSLIGGLPIAVEDTLGTDVFVGVVSPNTTYTSTSVALGIPDDVDGGVNYGVTGSIFVSAGAATDIEKFTIDVAITHPDVGELTITLTSPAGTVRTLYDGDLPGQADLDINLGREFMRDWDSVTPQPIPPETWETDPRYWTIWDLYGENSEGSWMLNVTDNVTGNTGTLDSWAVQINETWTGDMFVGNSITTEGQVTASDNVNIILGADLVFQDTAGNETLRIDGQTGVISGASANCPSGMTQFADFCIENEERGGQDWRNAIDTCFNNGRRLCSAMEWMMACRQNPGSVNNMTNNWEWTSDITRGPYEYAVRLHDCGNSSDHSGWGNHYSYRCCVNSAR